MSEKHKLGADAGISGWISLHMKDGPPRETIPRYADVEILNREEPRATEGIAEEAEGMASLKDRFPFLAFLAVAFSLVCSAVLAEFDYVRGASVSCHDK